VWHPLHWAQSNAVQLLLKANCMLVCNKVMHKFNSNKSFKVLSVLCPSHAVATVGSKTERSLGCTLGASIWNHELIGTQMRTCMVSASWGVWMLNSQHVPRVKRWNWLLVICCISDLSHFACPLCHKQFYFESQIKCATSILMILNWELVLSQWFHKCLATTGKC